MDLSNSVTNEFNKRGYKIFKNAYGDIVLLSSFGVTIILFNSKDELVLKAISNSMSLKKLNTILSVVAVLWAILSLLQNYRIVGIEFLVFFIAVGFYRTIKAKNVINEIEDFIASYKNI